MDHLLARILSELLLPPFNAFLLLLFGFVLYVVKWRRTGLAVAVLATATMLVLSMQGVANRARAPWPEIPARVAAPYVAADAIVVLGGGRYLNAPEYGGDTAAAGSLERVRYAAKLHRETGVPVLVSGGRPGGLGTRSEAEIMREILEQEFHVPVRWIEAASEDTWQNAEFSAALLKADGVRRVYLVTHGSHMARAEQAFGSHGIAAVPMPTGFVRPAPESVLSWAPSFEGIAHNRGWFYEALATLRP